MLLGDIVEIDAAGRLRVVGRKADIIIRGGKNISAVEVEEFVRAHPAVTMVAVVGVHDALFGEKVCAVVVTADGTELTADDLSSWLAAQGVTDFNPYSVTPGLPLFRDFFLDPDRPAPAGVELAG